MPEMIEEIRYGMLIMTKQQLADLIGRYDLDKLTDDRLSDFMAYLNDWFLQNFPSIDASNYLDGLRRTPSAHLPRHLHSVLSDNGELLTSDLGYEKCRGIALEYVFNGGQYADIIPSDGEDAERIDRNSIPF